MILICAVPLLLLAGWQVAAWRPRIVTLLESQWGWWVPFGLFWKLGRKQADSDVRWPYFFGLPAGWLYRAGAEFTLQSVDTKPRG